MHIEPMGAASEDGNRFLVLPQMWATKVAACAFAPAAMGGGVGLSTERCTSTKCTVACVLWCARNYSRISLARAGTKSIVPGFGCCAPGLPMAQIYVSIGPLHPLNERYHRRVLVRGGRPDGLRPSKTPVPEIHGGLVDAEDKVQWHL